MIPTEKRRTLAWSVVRRDRRFWPAVSAYSIMVVLFMITPILVEGSTMWFALGGLMIVHLSLCLALRRLMFRLYRQGLSENEICSNCAYDLTGNTSGLCPECGKMIERQA